MKKRYEFFKNKDASDVHSGYFSSTGKAVKKFKDTKGNSKNDKEVYQLIMRDKERLLSFEEETSFIFSHSALKEGWDNPNVFQICTLNETSSLMKKRQEIGRGMRLCLDRDGNRIYERDINKLVVIPNESYKSYVATLQTEFKESGQQSIKPEQRNKRKTVRLKKLAGANEQAFKNLWNHINQKTKYNFNVNFKNIISKIVDSINETLSVGNISITVERHDISMRNNSIQTVFASSRAGKRNLEKYNINDFISRIERETKLTRKTIVDIISRIDNFDLIFDNPEQFIRSISLIINEIVHGELINGIEYTKLEEFWDMKLFEDFESYENKMIEVENSIYDHVVYDSDGERDFAVSLEDSSKVKVFAKLPSWFTIDTPVGKYNPDWAIVWQENGTEELYLVRETKFYATGKLEDVLKKTEYQKIICAEKHFSVLGTDFKVSRKVDLSDFF